MSRFIVVGIDGSVAARVAARWAAREAEMRGADQLLVGAWDMPAYGFSFGAAAMTDDVLKALRRTTEENVANALDEVRAITERVDVSTKVVEGQAGAALLDASRDADLLVVGSRGLGGFRDLLLGSVSEECANHAACPVVVVRHLAHAA
jgi:nucleotide-binding universal stress UspA family protein